MYVFIDLQIPRNGSSPNNPEVRIAMSTKRVKVQETLLKVSNASLLISKIP